MGWVFLARDLRLNRRVALKVLSPGLLMEDGMGERFLREAQILGSLRHANIVGVHSVHHAGDLHFFAMDFIDGPSLDHVLRRRDRLPIQAARSIAYMVGSALDYGHHRGRGVIHRDIKPANVLLDSDGSVVVTDFGISKVLSGNTRLTRTGIVVGTPEFMSPEQCAGVEVTAKSDQYAVGALLYQMVCGAPPFSGSTVEVLLGHVQKAPPPVRDRRPDCPEELSVAIERMLAKAPEERFPDIASAVAAAGAKPVGMRSPARQELSELARLRASDTAAIDISSPLSPARSGEESLGGPVTGGISNLFIASPATRLRTGESIPIWVDARDESGRALPEAPIRLSVDNPDVARLDDGGLLVARRAGTVTVTATTGEIERHVTLEIVDPPTPARILVDPPTLDLWVGEAVEMRVRVFDGAEGELPSAPVRWVVDPDGPIEIRGTSIAAIAPGTGRATATSGLVSASVPVVVRRRAVAMVFDGAVEEAPAGTSFSVTPIVVDDEGIPLDGVEVVWASDRPDVAAVDATGAVHCLREGRVTITARHAGIAGAFELRVHAPAASAASVGGDEDRASTIHPRRTRTIGLLIGGGVVGLMGLWAVLPRPPAAPADGDAPATGAAPTGPSVEFALAPIPPLVVGDSVRVETDASAELLGRGDWTSDDSGIARVDERGVVTAVAEGHTEVALMIDGVEQRAMVSVQAPAPPPDDGGDISPAAPGPSAATTAAPPSPSDPGDEPAPIRPETDESVDDDPLPAPPVVPGVVATRIQNGAGTHTVGDSVVSDVRWVLMERTPGSYDVRLSKTCFLPHEESVQVVAGDTVSVVVTLEEDPAQADDPACGSSGIINP